MKYLDKAPFSGRANTPEFEKNYDKIDWSDKGESRNGEDKKVLRRPKGVLWWACLAHRQVICRECAWDDGPIEVKEARGLRG